MVSLSRRRFFMFAAPAIVAAPALMRVSTAVLDYLSPPSPDILALMRQRIAAADLFMQDVISRTLYSDDSTFEGGLAALLRDEPTREAHMLASYEYKHVSGTVRIA